MSFSVSHRTSKAWQKSLEWNRWISLLRNRHLVFGKEVNKQRKLASKAVRIHCAATLIIICYCHHFHHFRWFPCLDWESKARKREQKNGHPSSVRLALDIFWYLLVSAKFSAEYVLKWCLKWCLQSCWVSRKNHITSPVISPSWPTFGTSWNSWSIGYSVPTGWHTKVSRMPMAPVIPFARRTMTFKLHHQRSVHLAMHFSLDQLTVRVFILLWKGSHLVTAGFQSCLFGLACWRKLCLMSSLISLLAALKMFV